MRQRGLIVTLAASAMLALLAIAGAAASHSATPSPLIAFNDKLDVWLVRADGTGLKNLTAGRFKAQYGGPTDPTWAGDHRRLAFAVDDILYVADTVTGEITELARENGDVVEPAWNPKSDTIAATLRFVTNPTTGDADFVFSLFDVAKRSWRQLPSVPADAWPAWSPDGKRLVIGRAEALYTASATGSGAKRLTTPPRNARDRQPAWSKDGRLIAFTRITKVGKNDRYDLYTVKPDRTALKLIVRNADDATAAWSPDSKRLVYERYLGSLRSALDLVDADGKHPTRLKLPMKAPGNPAWCC